jgi:cytochrome c oxidase subunit 2
MNSEARSGNPLLIAIPIGIVGVLLAVGGYAISQLTPFLMGTQASAEAVAVDGLMRFMMFIGGMIFLLVQGLILWAVIFHRRRGNDETDGPNIHGNAMLEFIWTLIPVIIVFVLSVYSFIVYVDIREPKDNELVVNIAAQRFAFGFSYVDEVEVDGAMQEVVVRDTVLRTYVGRPVVLKMESADVIHAFWIPSMRVKQDMMPGRSTELRFTPTEAGRYPVVCTELCGGGHGGMRSEILVYPDEATYDEWNSTVQTCVLEPPEDPATRGRVWLESGKYAACAGCHMLDDLGWVGNIGPSLNGIADRADARATAAGDPDGATYIYNSVRNSQVYIVPGYGAGLMPLYTEDLMPEQDVLDIVAYLLTQGANPIPTEPSCPVPQFEDVMAQYEQANTLASAG